MTPARTFNWLANAAVCLLLLTAGCAPSAEHVLKPEVEFEKQIPEVIAEEAVPAIAQETEEPKAELEEQIPKVPPPTPAILALKFIPQDSTTYRLITKKQQSAKWTGNVPDDPDFESGLRIDRLEMTFTQQVQSIDNNGNAIAKITIEELKHHYETKDKPAMDFDSSQTKDQNHPLAKLIGQSYTIEIAPTGEVTKVLDVEQARAALKSSSAALQLLKPDEIKERHGTLVLPNPDKNPLQTGDDWSNIKTFYFGSMEPNSYGKSYTQKSYEKVYTLKKIKNIDDRQVAVVEMNTIPAPETAEQSLGEQTTAFDLSEMFNSTGTYTGRLKFNLTAGKIEKYREKLVSEWTTVLPPDKKRVKEPIVLILGAVRLYKLEKID